MSLIRPDIIGYSPLVAPVPFGEQSQTRTVPDVSPDAQ